MATNTLFRIALHEGIHSVAKRRDFPGGSSEQNIPLVFDYTHGLVAYEYETGIDDFGNRCDKSAFIMLEEAVVEDQTLRLLAKLSTNGKVYGDADYVQIVKDYNLKILPLFNNDFQVGLRFHQTSDPFGFFRQIGTKFGVQDPNWQAAEGLKFTQQFFPQ